MSSIPVTSGAGRVDAGVSASRAPAPQAPVSALPVARAAPVVAMPITSEAVDQALESLQKAIEPVAQNLQFSIDNDTGRTVVKVIDSNTQELIRQIPAEELLAITRALDRLQGLLLKQQA